MLLDVLDLILKFELSFQTSEIREKEIKKKRRTFLNFEVQGSALQDSFRVFEMEALQMPVDFTVNSLYSGCDLSQVGQMVTAAATVLNGPFGEAEATLYESDKWKLVEDMASPLSSPGMGFPPDQIVPALFEKSANGLAEPWPFKVRTVDQIQNSNIGFEETRPPSRIESYSSESSNSSYMAPTEIVFEYESFAEEWLWEDLSQVTVDPKAKMTELTYTQESPAQQEPSSTDESEGQLYTYNQDPQDLRPLAKADGNHTTITWFDQEEPVTLMFSKEEPADGANTTKAGAKSTEPSDLANASIPMESRTIRLIPTNRLRAKQRKRGKDCNNSTSIKLNK